MNMNFIDFDTLLNRMATLEQAAFMEFEDAMRDIAAGWLREFGVTETIVAREIPSCLLALGVLVVQRRDEIEAGRVLVWLRVQTRNLAVRYWRDADRQSSPAPKLTADQARRQVSKLDGTAAGYNRAAQKLNIPAGWLRRRHRRILVRFGI